MAPSISSTVSQSGSQRCCTAPVSTEQWEGRGLVRKAEEATQESARITAPDGSKAQNKRV
eukprot:2012204-Amphidinium_carterae.2